MARGPRIFRRILLATLGLGSPASGGLGSLRTTTMVNFATRAEMAPTAASKGASTTPTAATVTGISTNVCPWSSLTTIRWTFVDQFADLVDQFAAQDLDFFNELRNSYSQLRSRGVGSSPRSLRIC